MTNGLKKLAPAQKSKSLRHRTPSSTQPRRKRQFGQIASHACQECRKKRTKCDGQCPCTRCCKQGVCCQYESTRHASKADLRAEIRDLRKTIAVLVRPEAGAEAEAVAEDAKTEAGDVAFASISWDVLTGTASFSTDSGLSPDEHKPKHDNDHDNESSLAEGPSLENATGEHPQVPGSKPRQGDEISALSDVFVRALPLRAGPWPPAASETWTCVTGDLESTRHLIALYFCWEYPNFAPMSKEHFLRDFHARKGRFCSSLLVNALLSLGCQLSDRCPCGTAGPGSGSGKSRMCGDEFFEEARHLLASALDHSALMTIQALGIMSLRQARCGRVLESKHYAERGMLLAVEAGLHVAFDEHHPDRDVLAKTFWGTFMLHHTWSLVTGALPNCTNSLKMPPKPTILTPIDQSPWAPYIDGYTELHAQPSNVRSIYECFCRLAELVHQALYCLYTPLQIPTGSALLSIYQKCLQWYDRLPLPMKQGHNFTPSVLFMHLYYHFFILLIFRNVTTLRIDGSKTLPRDVRTQSARAILTLTSSYAGLYTLRRAPVFLPYFLFGAVCIYFDSYPSPNSRWVVSSEQDSKLVVQSFAAFEEMKSCHEIARHALRVLDKKAGEKKINVRIENTSAHFHGRSLKKEQQESGISSGRFFQDVPQVHFDGHASGLREQTQRPRTHTQDAAVLGLVWLQDMTPVGSREQMGRADVTLI